MRGQAGGGDAGAAYGGDGVTMTLDGIEQLTLKQMAEFKAPQSTPAGCVGTLWTAEKYAAEIDAMRICLLPPHWQNISVYDYPKLFTLLETLRKRAIPQSKLASVRALTSKKET